MTLEATRGSIVPVFAPEFLRGPDEPTASLPADEVERLFENMKLLPNTTEGTGLKNR